MESSNNNCLTPDVLREPHPCIPFELGDCPPHAEESTSSVSICSSDSDSPVASCIRGWRDRPRKYFGLDAPGFTIGSVLQYFWVPADKHNPRQHSYIAFNWDSIGGLKSVEMDDFKSPRRFLWERVKPKPQRMVDCPIDGSSSSSSISDGEHDTAGCVIRIFNIRGTYGCMNPDAHETASSSVSSSSSSSSDVYSIPTIFPQEQFQCYAIIDGLVQRISIADADPTLTDDISEMALEFDSTGKLCRVFWGGQAECDPNPCLWDRDKPPVDRDGNVQAGCVIPMMQQSDRILGGDDSWDIWLIYFDSLGRYIWSCAYMRICSCPVTCSHRFCESTSMPQPFCECRDLCLLTNGCQGLAYRPHECPATVSIDCTEALIPECVDDILIPGDCVYTWVGECCPAPFIEGTDIIISRASDWEMIHNACLYATEKIMTCTITDETQENTGGA